MTAKTISYRWHLRRRMAEQDMYATTQLGPLLAERGIKLSRDRSTGWSPASRSG